MPVTLPFVIRHTHLCVPEHIDRIQPLSAGEGVYVVSGWCFERHQRQSLKRCRIAVEGAFRSFGEHSELVEASHH